MPICAGCGQSITDRHLTTLDRAWHAACVRSRGCGKPIGEEPCIGKADRPYHVACYYERFGPSPQAAVSLSPAR